MDYISSELNHFMSRIKLFRSLIEKQDFKVVERYYDKIYVRWLDDQRLNHFQKPLYENPIELRRLDELFVNFDIDHHDVIQVLYRWHKHQTGFLNSVLLADYWAIVACQVNKETLNTERCIFVELSIYWYFHAMSNMPCCPDIYIRMIELLRNTNKHYTSDEIYQLQKLNIFEYSTESLKQLSYFGGTLPSQAVTPYVFQPKSQATTTSFYLFQCSLAQCPTYYAYHHYLLDLLKIDTPFYLLTEEFLYSDDCRQRSHRLIQPLYGMRYLHELNSLSFHHNELNIQTLLYAEELIDYLHTVSVNAMQKVDVYIAEMSCYICALQDMKDLSEPLKEIIYHKLDVVFYTLIGQHQHELQYKTDIQLKCLTSLLLFYQYNVEHQNISYLEDFILKMAACKRSCFFMLLWYSLAATNKYNLYFEQLNIHLNMILQLYAQQKVDQDIQNTWLILCEIGERHVIEMMLQSLAELGHAQSIMQLYHLYLGKHVDGLSVSHQINIKKSEYWLQQAFDLQLPEAYLVSGKVILFELLDDYPQILDQEKAQKACTLLEKAIQKCGSDADVMYAHALFLADCTQRESILTIYLPNILEHQLVSQVGLAYIAYIYTCASLYGHGMSHNLYLALYWNKNTKNLEYHDKYQSIKKQLDVPDGFGLAKIKHKKKIQAAKSDIPTWMKSVIQLYERHLIF